MRHPPADGRIGAGRRPPPQAPATTATAASTAPASDRERGVATAPAVGVFRAIAQVGARVQAGDRIATVDLLGIPQDVAAPIDGTVGRGVRPDR